MKYPVLLPTYKPQPPSPIKVSDNASISSELAKLFTNLGRVLLAWFAPDIEPTITQVTDREGQLWWRVDDPRTHRSYWMQSEIEVMIWLENN